MRLASVLAALALLAVSRAAADEPLHVAGAAVGPDGVLTRKTADVMGNDGPSHTPLLVIDDPPLHGAGRVSGRVEAFEIDSEAWLELAAVYPDGHRQVARTADPDGPAARLLGTAPARRFELAVPVDVAGARPVRLELAVGMLGPGVVSVSELRLEDGAGRAARAGLGAVAGGPWPAVVGGLVLVLAAGLALRRPRRGPLAAEPAAAPRAAQPFEDA